MFNKSEIRHLIISILVITLALAFDDGTESFQLAFWLKNFLIVGVMVAFSYIIHQIAHKLVARSHSFEAEYSMWGIQSFRWSPMSIMKRRVNPFPRWVKIFGRKYLIKSFPIGVVLSLIVTIFSNGMFFFLAIGQYDLLLKRGSRVGRKFIQVTDYEEAQIALVGPMSHVILMLVASFFNTWGALDQFIFINAALALFFMLPIHNLDGTKVFLGSPLLYVSSLVFIIAVITMVYFLSIIPLLIISGIATLIAAFLFFYFVYYKAS